MKATVERLHADYMQWRNYQQQILHCEIMKRNLIIQHEMSNVMDRVKLIDNDIEQMTTCMSSASEDIDTAFSLLNALQQEYGKNSIKFVHCSVGLFRSQVRTNHAQ